VVYSENTWGTAYPPETEQRLAIYKCNKDTDKYLRGNIMNSDYYAIILAKVFIITLFIMGMVSLAIELYNGTLPL
jgi:hypothetical protein